MIKFWGTKDDDRTLVLGLVLEPGNIQRLKQDEPIVVDLHHMLPDFIQTPCELVIAYDDDTRHAARMLLNQLASDGKVHIIPRGPEREQ